MPETIYRCKHCKAVYSDSRDAEACERSHKKAEVITFQQFLHADIGGPYPARITCRMEDGEVVQYERRKRR